MSNKYELEVLLRPAVEIYSAVVCVSAAIIMWYLPEVLLLPKVVSYGSVFVLLLYAALDMKNARTVLKYRAGMRRSKVLVKSMSKLPVSKDLFYIGTGFRWTQTHTQRLADTLEPRYAQFIDVPDNHDRFKNIRVSVQRIPLIGRLANLNTQLNPLREPDQAGGNPALNGVEPKQRDIKMKQSSRAGNTIVFGTTGAGKTRLMEILVSQDIRNNDVVVVVDPKGDGDLLKRMYIEAKRAGRLDEFKIFHLGFPDHSVKYNSIGNYSRITELATRTTNQLPGTGEAANFKEFAWRFVNIATRTLHALGDRVTYNKIRLAIDDIEPLMIRYFDSVLLNQEIWQRRYSSIAEGKTEKDIPRNFTGRSLKGCLYYQLYADYKDEIDELDDELIGVLIGSFQYEKGYYLKLVASITPLLEKLTSGKSGELLSPDYFDFEDKREVIDWRSVIRANGIVYVGLDALSEPVVAGAVGQSILSDITSIAGEVYKYGISHGGITREETPNIRLHTDEVNELIGDEFIPLVNKCRGAGIVVTAYTQSLDDIESKVGSAPKAGQIIDNFNHLIMMRVRSVETAELITGQQPEVNIKTSMAVTGATDSDYTSGSHFTSRNEDRISTEKTPMISASSMMQIPNGQAFAFVEAGRLYKVRYPLPTFEQSDADIPNYLDEMVTYMNGQVVASNWSVEDKWWL